MKKIIAVLLSCIMFTGALTGCRSGKKLKATHNVIILDGNYDSEESTCYFERPSSLFIFLSSNINSSVYDLVDRIPFHASLNTIRLVKMYRGDEVDGYYATLRIEPCREINSEEGMDDKYNTMTLYFNTEGRCVQVQMDYATMKASCFKELNEYYNRNFNDYASQGYYEDRLYRTWHIDDTGHYFAELGGRDLFHRVKTSEDWDFLINYSQYDYLKNVEMRVCNSNLA